MNGERIAGLVPALLLALLGSPVCAHAQRGLGGVIAEQAQSAERAKRWAVLIGVDEYEDDKGIGSLRYCASDMKRLHEILVGPNGGFAPGNVLLMTGGAENVLHRPTYSNLVTMIPRWLEDVGPNDDAIVAFSGHGIAEDSRCHILPSDAKRGALRLTSVSVAQVREWLESCRAKRKVLILDACHSGAGKAPEAMSPKWKEALEGGHGFMRLASCDANQKSNEDAALSAGVFSYHLAEALRGKGDLDGDSRVTIDEAYRYTCQEVRSWARAHGLHQDPLMSGRVVGGMLTLAYAPRQVKAADVEPPPPQAVEVVLRVSPMDASITVDGKLLELQHGGRIAVLRVPHGRHVLEAKKEGYVQLEESVDIPKGGGTGEVHLAPISQQVTVHLKSGRTITGALLSRAGGKITVSPRGRGSLTLAQNQYDRIELGAEAPAGESAIRIVPRQPTSPATPATKPLAGAAVAAHDEIPKGTLPRRLSRAFMVPTEPLDQYGNPVVTRGGSHADTRSQLPFEVWLVKPRMEFVLVLPGEFMMGSEDGEEHETPVHRVQITKPYYLAKYELTQGQWQAVMHTKPWSGKVDPNTGKSHVRENERHSATYINWHDCQELTRRLNSAVRLKVFRLPTEAEWEYACRAGSTTKFYFGDDKDKLDEYAWHARNCEHPRGRFAHPVGQKRPNAWGFYDMHGNVYEFCQDVYGRYADAPATDPCGPPSGAYRVLRSSAFLTGPTGCGSGHRLRANPRLSFIYSLGVRLAMSLP